MKNNVEILKLLLQYDPNVNLLHKPNTIKFTTIHLAAKKQNLTMMKLLIQHGFDCDKFINNIIYCEGHRSVFLEFCYNGNVECMDYLMTQCKNIIDVWQRDIDGNNGLHIAVNKQHVSMVQYLLDNVYNNGDMKRKIFDQTVGINGKHISCVAAERGTTQDGLVIFKLLKENQCTIHHHAIGHAASYSSLVLDYMLHEQLYPNKNKMHMYLTKQFLRDILANAQARLVHKNILIVVKYLCNMRDKVSIKDYQKWILNIFYRVVTYGTMDGYFQMFKEMLKIWMHNDDWKCFTTSKIIDKKLLINLEKKINNPTNTRDVCDVKWCLLLQTMINSFDDKTLLNKYDTDNNESDCKRNDHYYCHKKHLMNQVKNNNTKNDLLSNKKCDICNQLRDINLLSLECLTCQKYICNECFNSIRKLIELLENEEYNQFNQTIDQCKTFQQENIIQTVELYIILVNYRKP